MEDDAMLHLPMDITNKILTHITDPASVAPIASSCKFWRNLIKASNFLRCLRWRHRDHGFTRPSSLASSTKTALSLRAHVRIVTKAGLNAIKPLSLGTFIRSLGASLNFYEPVASQDSFLALSCRPQDTNGHATLPRMCYASATLSLSQSFQLVAIWIRDKKFIYLCFSSKTGIRTRSPRAPELMPSLYFVPSPAAASHGVIHWLCGSWKNWTLTHVATLHIGTQELPPEAKRYKAPLLANSADGALLLLFVKGLQMSLWKNTTANLAVAPAAGSFLKRST